MSSSCRSKSKGIRIRIKREGRNYEEVVPHSEELQFIHDSLAILETQVRRVQLKMFRLTDSASPVFSRAESHSVILSRCHCVSDLTIKQCNEIGSF